jgi:hypothetical protein
MQNAGCSGGTPASPESLRASDGLHSFCILHPALSAPASASPSKIPPVPPSPLERAIDQLFALPLSEFIAARNALAARLKKEGDAGASARVKGLARPSISAWAVNQVYWHDRDAYERLVAAGDALRTAQERMLTGRGADVREVMRARQEAARGVVERAMRFLRESGNAATDATRQRVAVTVDALAAYGSEPRGHAHGRLERDLDPPGFEALSFLGGIEPAPRSRPPAPTATSEAPKTPALRVIQGGAGARVSRKDGSPAAGRAREKAERAERERLARERREEEQRRKAALTAAQREVAAAERALERAAAAERGATALRHERARELEEGRRQLVRVEERLNAAESDLQAARTRREQAEQARAAAEQRRTALEDI